jgi:hypothetical protein
MKPWYGLAAALLLSLSLSCSRAPVASDPQPAVKESPTTERAAVNVKPESKETMEPLPPPGRDDNPEVIQNKEAGVLRGLVHWEGPEPLRPTPRLRIDPVTHGVAGVVIALQALGKTKTAPPPAEPVRLVVDRGEYRPHIALAQKGSTIELRSIEERADFQAGGAATFSETIQRGDSRVFRLSSPGLIKVRSQLQPARAPAYVWVLDGSPGTLTATDGQFRLPPVPPGEYELTLWHEDWHADESAPPRILRVRIALGQGEGAEVRWTLAERP